MIKKRVDDATLPDHISGGINGIPLKQVNVHKNVDEVVSRMWRGQPRIENQANISERATKSLDPPNKVFVIG